MTTVSFAGRTAVVTGGSRGIGRATAEAFLDGGARGVVITGRTAADLEEAAAALDPERVEPVSGNVSDDAHAGDVIETAVEAFGSCDVVVNNAGTNPVAGHIGEVEMTAIDKTWAVNLRAPLVFARAAWSGWMREHGGVIVNVGSVGGLRPGPLLGAYNIAKAGLHHMTRQLAHEMAPGVRVNAVAAAVVRTRLSRMLWESDPDAVAEMHPLGRLGEPEDVAAAVAYLASDAASWVTGVVLPVDGGVSGAGGAMG